MMDDLDPEKACRDAYSSMCGAYHHPLHYLGFSAAWNARSAVTPSDAGLPQDCHIGPGGQVVCTGVLASPAPATMTNSTSASYQFVPNTAPTDIDQAEITRLRKAMCAATDLLEAAVNIHREDYAPAGESIRTTPVSITPDEQCIQTDWRPHHGGDCPVPIDARVKIKRRDGDVFELPANIVDWSHQAYGPSNVMEYRIVKPKGEGL